MDKPTIVIVEDEEIIAVMLQQQLEELEYPIVGLARNCEQALQMAAATQPDLVLMDIGLQGSTDGVDTAMEIRHRFHIPVIYLTAYSDEETLGRAEATEPLGYILKPFEIKEVHSTIKMGYYKYKMELRLRESEAKYRDLAENSTDIIGRIDHRGRLLFVNSAGCALFGRSYEELIGKSLSELDVSAGTVDFWREKVAQVFATRRPVEGRCEVGGPERRRVFECRFIPEFREDGGMKSVLTISRDVSEKVRAEEMERLHLEQVMQADKLIALGTLVSGVAHEINNPNNFILLNSKILTQVWDDILPILDQHYTQGGDFVTGGLPFSQTRDKIRGFITGITEGSNRIKNIVYNLKDFSRPGNPDLQQEIDINAVVSSSIHLMANMLEKCTERFTVQYGADLPPVHGNFQRLEQVVINLLQNSCEALTTRQQGIHVETLFQPQTARVEIRVHDEGVGIPDDHRRRILDPFFTTKRDCGGTGLGLSISVRIVRDHRGTLEFTSGEAGGTTAVVALPAVVEKSQAC